MPGDNSTAHQLDRCVRQLKRGMLVVIGFSFAINLLLLSAPLYMLQIYDRVLSSRSTDTLLFLTLIIALALLTLAALELVRSAILSRLGAWLDRQLAAPVLVNSIRQPLRTGAAPGIQGLRDLNQCRQFLGNGEFSCFMDAPWAPLFLVFVFLLHPVLGYLALAGAILLFTLAVINELLTRPLLLASGNAAMSALAQAESGARNGDVVEGMGMMPNLIGRWRQRNAEALSLQMQAGFRNSAVAATSRFLRQLLQIGMLGIGAWLVIRGELSPGAMIAGSILMSRALAPVEQAISTWRNALAARAAFDRLQQSAADMPEPRQSMPLPAPKGNLAVEAVTYMHPGQGEAVLKNIRFSLPAGTALGIIGPSGAGKTTLIRLLLGNLAPRLGHVRLDGMDVSQWPADDLGRHCGYLPQDIELFSGTIAENIARLGECDAEKIIRAATLAGCHDMILRLPKGYDTQAGEGGLSLSGGERQRIALARALYGDPRYIILDEPNASLDAVGEAALLDAIRALKAQGTTLIIIGHRPGIIQHVDSLLVLNKGQVQHFGSREDVLAILSGNANVQDITAVKNRQGEGREFPR